MLLSVVLMLSSNIPPWIFRPAVTVMVDRALEINHPSIFPLMFCARDRNVLAYVKKGAYVKAIVAYAYIHHLSLEILDRLGNEHD